MFADFGRLHPETTLEVVSLLGMETQSALDGGRIQLALCDAEFLEGPLRWSKRKYHVPARTLEGWEQGRRKPDLTARILLTVIERDPQAVARALTSEAG